MGPQEVLIIGIVALIVIFGAKKIPEMARSMGRAQSEFKKGMKEGQADLDETPAAAAPTPPPAAATPPPAAATPPAAVPPPTAEAPAEQGPESAP